jgi:phage gp45-like
MKTYILSLAVVLAVVSCKKKETVAPTPTPVATPAVVTPVATAGFKWTENGGAEITADSAYWTTSNGATGIRASKGGFTYYFEINWAGLNNTAVGAKTLNATNGDFTYLNNNVSYGPAANTTLNITAFASDKLSGNFSFAVTGGTVTTLAATFTSLPKK